MRKLFALLSVATVMTLASCGAKSDESAATADTTAAVDTLTAVPADTTASVDTTAVAPADTTKAAAPAAH
ncbi:MAG: hypothetical protein JWM14_1 [Chitinophagaceae bacterium]|nr:hypothetical protein [Chitinophagaceae bacterium]